MKKILKLGLAGVALCSLPIFHSCNLQEKNLATVSLDKSFTDRPGLEGLINGCYNDLYFLYGLMWVTVVRVMYYTTTGW
jgi:starch-binding outer membrane protein, SusD/RagB family